MTAASIPQAAGITGILTAAGLDASAVHSWFHHPRRELRWLSPASALALGAVRSVLALAQADAVAIRQDLERAG